MSSCRRTALLAGAAALAFNGACYSFQPVAGPPLAEAQRVRVYLTTDGTAELARFLGPRVQNADGLLAGMRPDGALTLGVEAVQLTDGVRQPWSGEGLVTFPANFVVRVERSELNKARTIVGSVALSVGLFAIAALALKTTGSQSGADAGGGTPPP